jgi:hypothetical protein
MQVIHVWSIRRGETVATYHAPRACGQEDNTKDAVFSSKKVTGDLHRLSPDSADLMQV